MVTLGRLRSRRAALVMALATAGPMAALLTPATAFCADPLPSLQRICGDPSDAKLIADSIPIASDRAQAPPADTLAARLEASRQQEAAAYGDAAKRLYEALRADTSSTPASDVAASDDMSQLGRILQWTSAHPVAGAMHRCVANRAQYGTDSSPIRLGRALAALGEYEAIFGHDADSRTYYAKSIEALKPLGDQANGDKATAASGLADVLLKEGKTDQATLLYQKALALNERDPNLGARRVEPMEAGAT